jgi:sugar phosphate permease
MGEPSVAAEKQALVSPEAGAARPTQVRYQVLAAACVLAVITYIHRLGFAAGNAAIMRDLGLSNAQMGDVAAAFLVAYGLGQVPGGLLGDRFGARHLLTILVLAWSFLTGAVALAAFLPAVVALRFGYLLVNRFLFGLVQAGGFPVLARVLADWMPTPERGFAQGAMWTFSRLGGAIVPILLARLFYVCGSWPVPFVLIAGLGVLWCAAFWPWFRNRPEEMRQVNAAERQLITAGRASGAASARRSSPGPLPWRQMLGSVSVWSVCLMYGCTGFAGNFFTSMMPLYLSAHRHLSDRTAALLAALPLAAGVVACIGGGVVSDWVIRRWGRRWGRPLVGGSGLVCAALSFLSLLWVKDTWLLGLLLSATFFFNDLTMGPAWAACADIGERYAGTLSGAMNMTGAFAGAVATALVGRLFDAGRAELMFVLFAASWLLGALCWLGVDVSKPIAGDPAKEAALQ